MEGQCSKTDTTARGKICAKMCTKKGWIGCKREKNEAPDFEPFAPSHFQGMITAQPLRFGGPNLSRGTGSKTTPTGLGNGPPASPNRGSRRE